MLIKGPPTSSNVSLTVGAQKKSSLRFWAEFSQESSRPSWSREPGMEVEEGRGPPASCSTQAEMRILIGQNSDGNSWRIPLTQKSWKNYPRKPSGFPRKKVMVCLAQNMVGILFPSYLRRCNSMLCCTWQNFNSEIKGFGRWTIFPRTFYFDSVLPPKYALLSTMRLKLVITH